MRKGYTPKRDSGWLRASLISGIILMGGTLSPCRLVAQASNALPFSRAVKIEVIAGKPAEIKGGDWDDKSQKISVRLKMSNQDTRQSFAGHTATVSVFGQSAIDRSIRKVLMQEKIDLPLEPLKTVEHAMKPGFTTFDKTGVVFGFFYDGWIIVVKDASGKTVYVKSTSPSLEKLEAEAEKLVLDKCYDRRLHDVPEPGRRRSSLR